MKQLEAPQEPMLTYSVKDDRTSIELKGYGDGTLDLKCHIDDPDQPGELMEISLTKKGVKAFKRALSLWETAMDIDAGK
jgi:hypothetical protein